MHTIVFARGGVVLYRKALRCVLYVMDGHFLSVEKQIHSSYPGYLAMTILLSSPDIGFWRAVHSLCLTVTV